MKKPSETPSKTHFQAAISFEFDATIKALKDKLGLANNADVLHTLIGFYENPFKSGLSPKQKIEKWVQKELLVCAGKINTHTAKNYFLKNENNYQPNVSTMKEVFELYKAEIEAHNAKFE